MAELDDYYYDLKDQRSYNERRQREVKSEIDDIDDKIDRLKRAYRTLDDQKESIKNQKKIIRRLKNSYKWDWKGQHATAIYQACSNDGELGRDYQSYINEIDSIEDEINREITRLKNQKNKRWGILQGLLTAWNNLCTEINNYFN